MKHFLPGGLMAALIALFPGYVKGQCPTCTPDYECISADGYPTVCPLEAPVGFTGAYYEHQLTFYIPTEFEDPGTGILATLLEVTFTAASGIPYGLEFTINDADSTYYPVDGENHGCATICGVPLLPGNYNVSITVSILATAFGFEVTQVQSFPYLLIIEQGQGGTASFTYDNPADCGGLEVNYNATVEAPEPSITTYFWDFGNGQVSTDAHPGTITYDSPGEYLTTLTTTISNYTLASVSVSNLSDNWDGDIDDVLFPPADPYFIITDAGGNLVYTSGTVDNVTSTTWTDVDLDLGNPPYSIQFMDEDDVSDDDNLGTMTVVIEEGTNFFDIGNGTVGTITVHLTESVVVTDEATVTVFPMPDATYVNDGNVLHYDNPDLVSFIWYHNGIPTDSLGSSFTMTEGGQYYCVVANAYGCSATSPTYIFCPELNIQYDELAWEVFVTGDFETYQWYYNGLEVEGATLSYLSDAQPGNYAVEVTTDYGCTIMSEVYVLATELSELSDSSWSIYPNPVRDFVIVHQESQVSTSMIRLFDITGKIQMTIYSKNVDTRIDLSDLAPGIYFLEANYQLKRLVKQ